MADVLDTMAGRSADPLMRTLLAEIRAGAGISEETAHALSTASPHNEEFAEFLRLCTRRLAGAPLLDFAIVLVAAAGRSGVGKNAIDACLDRLDPMSREILGGRMADAARPESVPWFHTRLVVAIQDIGVYRRFLVRHADTVLERCADEMYAFVLATGRRPDLTTAEVLEILLKRTGAPSRAETKWIEWIVDGFFDLHANPEAKSSDILYKILLSQWEEPAFARVITTARSHLRRLLSSESSDDVKAGLHHLVAAADVRYPDAESFAAMTDDVPHASQAQQGVLPLIREALLEVAAFCRDPGDPRRNEWVAKSLSAVYAIKDATIFGRPLS